MKRILLIDGNYFSSRAMFALQRQIPDMTLTNIKEKTSLRNVLNVNLLSLISTFKNEKRNLIDNVIFVSDSGSWRKYITPHIPYFLSESEKKIVKYKENRVEQKEKSLIDWDEFYRIHEEFTNSIQDIIPTFKINKLEGDDLLCLLVDKLSKKENTECLIFCNDGDIEQLTNYPNVMIYRNTTNSKENPFGSIILSKEIYNKIYGTQDLLSSFLNAGTTDEYFEILSSVVGDQEKVYNRVKDANILVGQPYSVLFHKSISGDKKDNLFPILRWEASTGTRNYKVSDRHIIKAFNTLGFDKINNDFCKECLTDSSILIKLLVELFKETKQLDYVRDNKYIKSIAEHLLHNIKMNCILDTKHIPEDLKEEFNLCYSTLEDMIFNSTIDFIKLGNLATNNVDDASINIETGADDIINEIMNI